jgi:hypothetical protein
MNGPSDLLMSLFPDRYGANAGSGAVESPLGIQAGMNAFPFQNTQPSPLEQFMANWRSGTR